MKRFEATGMWFYKPILEIKCTKPRNNNGILKKIAVTMKPPIAIIKREQTFNYLFSV